MKASPDLMSGDDAGVVVLVCGGRGYDDYDRVCVVLDGVHEETPVGWVITGAARGADLLGERWARFREVAYTGYPAQWSRYGRRAGPVRNGQMLEVSGPDVVVAFPGGAGTRGMCRLARAAGVRVVEAGR